MDLPTTIRLARLALEDLAESRRHNSKGEGTVHPEDEIVFRMQVEYVERAIQAIEDAEFARSFDIGVEANHPSLSTVGDWQLADLRAALALLGVVGASDEKGSSGSPTENRSSTLNVNSISKATGGNKSTLVSTAPLETALTSSSSGSICSSGSDFTDGEPYLGNAPSTRNAIMEGSPILSCSCDISRSSGSPMTISLDRETSMPGSSRKGKEVMRAYGSSIYALSDAKLSETRPVRTEESRPSGSSRVEARIEFVVPVDFTCRLSYECHGTSEERAAEEYILSHRRDSITKSVFIEESIATQCITDSEAAKIPRGFINECITGEITPDSRQSRQRNPTAGSVITAPSEHILDATPSLFEDRAYELSHVMPSQFLLSRSESKLVETRSCEQCAACLDFFSGDIDTLQAPCGDHFCRPCIIQFVEACTRDESVFPIRCCNRSIPYNSVFPLLPPNLQVFLRSKRIELGIPAIYRVYCSNSTCSSFLGSSEGAKGDLSCSQCSSTTCASCKEPSHRGESCADNAAIREVRALAQTERWQTCPGCNAIIELAQGCHHITCLCRAQFCYLCAVPWKQCGCPQWDENFILQGGGAVEGAYEVPQAVAELPGHRYIANGEPIEAVAEVIDRHRLRDPGYEDDSDDDLDLGDNQPEYEAPDWNRGVIAADDFAGEEEIAPNDIYDLLGRVEDYNEVHFEEAAERDTNYDEEIMSERAGYSDSEGDEESGEIGVEYGEEVQLEENYDDLDEDEEGSLHSLYDSGALGNNQIANSDDPEDDAVVFDGFSEQEGFAEAEAEERPCYEDEAETGYCEAGEDEDCGAQNLCEDADLEYSHSEELDSNELPESYLESNDHDSDIPNDYGEPDHYESDYYDGPDPDQYDEPDHYDDEPGCYDELDGYDDEPDYYDDDYDEYD